MIDYSVNSPEDENKVNAFIWDLRDLLEKHNVSLEAVDCAGEGDKIAAMFTCYEDINNLVDTDYEIDWFCEIVDMWPQEYNLASSGKIVKVSTCN